MQEVIELNKVDSIGGHANLEKEKDITQDSHENKTQVEYSNEPLLMDLSEDNYVGKMKDEILQNFVCMVCYGVVYKPIKCTQCETLFCKACSKNNKVGYGYKKFECFKKCGSTTSTEKLGRIETTILESLKFACQNEGCSEKIVYKDYMKHLNYDCKVLRYSSILMNDEDVSDKHPLVMHFKYT